RESFWWLWTVIRDSWWKVILVGFNSAAGFLYDVVDFSIDYCLDKMLTIPEPLWSVVTSLGCLAGGYIFDWLLVCFLYQFVFDDSNRLTDPLSFNCCRLSSLITLMIIIEFRDARERRREVCDDTRESRSIGLGRRLDWSTRVLNHKAVGLPIDQVRAMFEDTILRELTINRNEISKLRSYKDQDFDNEFIPRLEQIVAILERALELCQPPPAA
ncbi:hypothetical protein PMAYCL1PPCAC_13789, partial [Pristionchus mayeri]